MGGCGTVELIRHRPTWKECLQALPAEVTAFWAGQLGRDQVKGTAAVISEWRKRLIEGPAGLSGWEQKAMDFLIWQVGEEGLPESKVSESASCVGLSPARLRVGLSLLAGRGLVFRLRLPGGERMFWCPREVREAVLSSKVTPCPLPGTDISGENRLSGIWDHLFLFLVMIDREGLPLTKERQLPRKIERKWAADLELDSDGLQGSYWDDGSGNAAFLLLMELADRLNLIAFEPGRVKLRRKGVARWLLQSWSIRLDELWAQVEQAFLSRHPRQHPLWWWLQRQSGPNWYEWEETVTVAWQDLSVKGSSPSVRGEVADVLKEWLAALTWMGWTEQVGREGRTWWRWSPWVPLLKQGSKGWKGRVQPDGEVLLPPGTPLDRRWRLAQFADYMGGDPLVHYLLTPESVQQGATKGLTTVAMTAELEELTGRTLPPMVAESIREWGERQGARLEAVWLAELAEEGWADEWTQCLSEHPDWGRVVSRRIFALQEEGAKAFKRWVAKQGIPLAQEHEGSPVWWKELDEVQDRWEEGESLAAWKVERPDFRPETAIPGWSSLPRMWTDSLRPYHESTLREVFRQASRLELDVSWSGPDGRVHRITPTSVAAEGQEWMVRGKGEDGAERSVPLSGVSQVGILPPWKE
ncbi:hypothetical protein [Desmospora profundinema]|uniref:Helicase XPB/Ssl2 N-terminal domain-containing protein n=1 Tax=Desmospora profundinema TaxID=1571184 RepID=A0ABU1IMT3_9BACL|nr:hypothetical protein [Desmospora profundinema]MDR6225269.1 hypothetical protein [Desmospora profundinema]